MRIGILGSGNVGGTLGRRWAQSGHQVTFASRDPQSERMRGLVQTAGGTARAANARDTAAGADVVLLATPWPATEETLRGIGSFDGKVLIDATNPLLPSLAGLEVGTSVSGAELVAGWAPGARVVKAFNTIGFNIMADPGFGDDQALMFYCGDDPEAKATVQRLAVELGFNAQDAGALVKARLLEPFALLWISLAFGGLGREFAFNLLRR